ncbi:MAG: ABC transporter permease [Thermoproteota archaeon]
MRWIIRRVMLLLSTFIIATSMDFVLIRLTPGNPIDLYIQDLLLQGYPYDAAVKMAASLLPFIPNEPLYKQYIDFMLGAIKGDFGKSIYFGQDVTVILGYALPWTLFVVSISLILSFIVGVVTGMFIAYKRGGMIDKFVSIWSSVFSSIPQYIVGFFLILFFALQLKIFPSMGAYSPWVTPGWNIEFIKSVLYHATLPILTYFFTSVGGWILTMKSSTLSVLGEYYVTAAEARGLKDSRIAITYVGRNAILPLFTRLAISFGYIFGGSVLIENTFSYPGIGRFLNLSITYRDYPLTSGCFLIITFSVVISNFIADLLYSRLDPRITLE